MIEWVKVEDGTPNHIGTVLIYMPECIPTHDISFYSGGGWAFTDANLVTHWAEITPPEEDV